MKKRTIWIIVIAVIIVAAVWFFTRKKTIADLVYEGKNIPAPDKNQILLEADQQTLLATKIQQVTYNDAYAKWRSDMAAHIAEDWHQELIRMKGKFYGDIYYGQSAKTGELQTVISQRMPAAIRIKALSELINQGYNMTIK